MKRNQRYIIGVDGGGTKTIVALSSLNGKILNLVKTGPSSPRNMGIEKGAENVAKGIKKIKGWKNVKFIFVGLPAVQEEFKSKKEEIKKEILKKIKGFKGEIVIDSDQIVAFRSGTNEKDGILLIAGTGCVAHGWRKNKEVTVSGWGWLADEGSAFWVGQKAFQAFLKDLDDRGPKTLITKTVFRNFGVKNRENFLSKIYSQNPTEIIPKLSVLSDKAARKGDSVATKIMIEAAKELALSAKVIVEKLGFEKNKFPLVLVGGIFKSKVVLEQLKKEIKKFAPKADFVLPKKKPVIGAVKLAIELID